MSRILLAVMFLCVAVMPALAQDPVKVAPQFYKVEVDNDQVRILRAHRGPHEIAPTHSHPAYVSVYLTDLHQTTTEPGEKPKEANRKAGQVVFNQPITHMEENLADQPLEAIVIELKPGAERHPATMVPAELDPLKLAPKNFKLELENNQVRILRSTRGPHEKVPMHEHPAYVAVYLTDAHQRTTDAAGKVQEVTRKRGEVSFNNPLKHAEENLSDQPFEAIVVELK